MRELLAIAFPMVVSQACFTVMTFTDRLFLSRLGSEQMDAAMAGGLTAFVMMTFFMGFSLRYIPPRCASGAQPVR